MVPIAQVITVALVGLAPQSDDQTRLAEAVRTAFEANRVAFTYGSIRFKYSIGYVSTAEDAFREEWTKRATAEGSYVHDGPRIRYDRIFSAADMIADVGTPGTEKSRLGLSSMRLVTDGEKTLFDYLYPLAAPRGRSLYQHASQITAGSNLVQQEATVPLRIGLPGMEGLLDYILMMATTGKEGPRIASISPQEQMDGFNVIRIEFEYPDARVEHWVDLEHGAVSRMCVSKAKNGSSDFRYKNEDLRLVAGRGWLPYRYTVVNGKRASRVTITEADFDHRPAAEAFQLEYPEPRVMIDATQMVRYEPRKVWDLVTLPGPTAAGARKIESPKIAPGPPPVMPGAREPAPWWPWTSLFVLMTATFGVIIHSRRRHNERADR